MDRRRKDTSATLHITLHEGMKRQVRRMFEAVGIRVLHLKRLAIGGVTLGDLPEGQWRKLTPKEIETLREPRGRAPTPKKRVRRKRR